MSNANWQDNAVQFPRLLAEIMANCDLDMPAIAGAMDLSVEQLSELFDRADQAWEDIKHGKPASLEALLIEGKISVTPDPMDGWVARSFGDATKFTGRTPYLAAERCWAAGMPQPATEEQPAPAGQFVERVFTENTGGGCMVDLIILKDGRVIGLYDEVVVLYPTTMSFYVGYEEGNHVFPTIWRPKKETAPGMETPKLGTYIDGITVEYTVDLLTLDTGEILGIDAESVCLYENETVLMEGEPDSGIRRLSLISDK